MTRHRKQAGGTLLEAALVLLLFITFLMAIIEFGRAYNIYQNVTNAAREGARFAVAPCSLATGTVCPYTVPPGLPNGTDTKAQVQKYLDSNGVQNATIKVCGQTNTGDCDSSFAVTLPTCKDNPSYCLCTTLPSTYCAQMNLKDTTFTTVQVTAPYAFILFKQFGTLNIHSQARMRDETN